MKIKPRRRRWRRRDERGRFLRVEQTPEEKAAAMAALYEWRDARREYNTQLTLAEREQRFVGLRSLAIFATISAVLVGVLIASVSV